MPLALASMEENLGLLEDRVGASECVRVGWVKQTLWRSRKTETRPLVTVGLTPTGLRLKLLSTGMKNIFDAVIP